MRRTRWAQQFGRVLGDELRRERKRRGWYRRELLDHLREFEGVDLSMQTLGTYEEGSRQISAVRLVQITRVLDASISDLLQRTYDRVFEGEARSWAVDLKAASKVRDPQLEPLRRWAASRLGTLGTPKIMRLDQAALEPLALLCGMGTRELARQLPTPHPTPDTRCPSECPRP